jgi:hypothetical protein
MDKSLDKRTEYIVVAGLSSSLFWTQPRLPNADDINSGRRSSVDAVARNWNRTPNVGVQRNFGDRMCNVINRIRRLLRDAENVFSEDSSTKNRLASGELCNNLLPSRCKFVHQSNKRWTKE